MLLKDLLKEISDVKIYGSTEIEITGISENSKQVNPGNLFVAKKGQTHDASRFIPEAVASGAVAILCSSFQPSFSHVVHIIHPDPHAVEAKLAKVFYGNPVEKLFLIGITGTNGKTTTSYLIKHLIESLYLPCGLIGTVDWFTGKDRQTPNYTTPDLLTNYQLFDQMVKNGCGSAVMEVSSQAIDQRRVEGIEFDIAVFTNLTQDHLDYHKSMEVYAEAKAKLFKSLSSEKLAVVNVDNAWSSFLLQGCQAKTLSYGIDKAADVRATDVELSDKGIRFKVNYEGKTAIFSSSLIGRFNVYNYLAAISVGLGLGISFEKMEVLQSFKTVRGRLERVQHPGGLNIFVDYAHTDDALENVLNTLQEIRKGRIITIFGCGGNRDTGKRPKMGRIAEQFSDIAIVTSDNPRNENPEQIIQEILAGFSDASKPYVIPDRREAIRKAIQLATPEDVILIAGKGHETTQIFAHETIHFDDRLVALEESV
jgi:UDP-N-acetylmuramoyl-L-alanyl-D-glutamate--2,6-diaminopimelate ligase